MFATLNAISPRRLTRSFGISLALHLLFLAWFFYSPSPQILAPSSVVYGKQGSVITQLYWPNRPFTDGSAGASASLNASSDSDAQARITWRDPKDRKKRKRDVPVSRTEKENPENAKSESAKAAKDQAFPAGSPYGSAWTGSVTGDEVRPALPVSASDPVVSSSDLAGLTEGDVVIEITIDERGKIIEKVVLQTFAPAIDAKVLAALETWHFLPATRNGVAIPSKQDVHYHFKPRNG